MSRRVAHTAWISVALAMLAALLMLRPGADTNPEPPWVQTAQETLQPFKQRLIAALGEGLAEGPEAAVDACRLEAPRIADALSSDTRRVGRTSHRLRNQANAPKPWMRPILQELRTAAPGESRYRAVRIDPEWVGYAEPIYMQPICVTCHGTELPPSLGDHLHAAYPQDEATGFAVGDFRGLFWVELKTAMDATATGGASRGGEGRSDGLP